MPSQPVAAQRGSLGFAAPCAALREQSRRDPHPNAWQRLKDRDVRLLAAVLCISRFDLCQRFGEPMAGSSSLPIQHGELIDEVQNPQAHAFTDARDQRHTGGSEHALQLRRCQTSNAVSAEHAPKRREAQSPAVIRRRGEFEDGPQPRFVCGRDQPNSSGHVRSK